MSWLLRCGILLPGCAENQNVFFRKVFVRFELYVVGVTQIYVFTFSLQFPESSVS